LFFFEKKNQKTFIRFGIYQKGKRSGGEGEQALQRAATFSASRLATVVTARPLAPAAPSAAEIADGIRFP